MRGRVPATVTLAYFSLPLLYSRANVLTKSPSSVRYFVHKIGSLNQRFHLDTPLYAADNYFFFKKIVIQDCIETSFKMQIKR